MFTKLIQKNKIHTLSFVCLYKGIYIYKYIYVRTHKHNILFENFFYTQGGV